MTCRSCSADIDAKAIVCYRCGTPTASGTTLFPGQPRRPVRGRLWLLVAAVVAVLAGAAYLVWYR